MQRGHVERLTRVLDGAIRELVDGFSLYSVVMILSPIVLVSCSHLNGGFDLGADETVGQRT